MVTDSGALRYEVGHGSSEIGSQFNLAMMTHVDEITMDKHLQMMYYEFLEGVARVAHKIKIFPNIDRYQFVSDIKKKKLNSDIIVDEGEGKDDNEEEKIIENNEIDKNDISHIINVEGKPLYAKLEIFIKLLEFSWVKKRNFYEIYED